MLVAVDAMVVEVAAIEAAGERRTQLLAGDTIDLGPSIDVEVIHGSEGNVNESQQEKLKSPGGRVSLTRAAIVPLHIGPSIKASGKATPQELPDDLKDRSPSLSLL